MSKLPKEHQFLDLSDYGRNWAFFIANSLKNTKVTPIHLTSTFIISGLIAIFCIINQHYFAAAFFLILKSILDAADGELSRVKKSPSYIGRYYDSIADIILNFFFIFSFWHISNVSFSYALLAFIGIQLQGTLYNYYYVILRNQVSGDVTSRVFEDASPKAYEGESQSMVNIFYKLYNVLYISFDKIIYWLDRKAMFCKTFPKWFMTMVSTFGLGFQLLVMAILPILNMEEYVIPYFIYYSLLIFVFIGLRRMFIH